MSPTPSLAVIACAVREDEVRHLVADLPQVPGDASLLRDLLAGRWNESRFLLVPPRHGIALTADATIIRAIPPPFSP
jgi:hypothetical protein